MIKNRNLFLLMLFCGMMMGCLEDASVFDKLKGEWIFQAENNVVIAERWEQSDRNGWHAFGWTTQLGDTIFKETIEILNTDSGWYYKAHPMIALRPTFFKIQSITDSGFVAVNMKHDYPQTIRYHFQSAGLTITIQGRPNFEEELTEEWTMKRLGH